MNLYPLLFRPRYVEKLWGGSKIQTILGKALPADKLIGESWELYDFAPGVMDKTDQWVSSVVSNGFLAGRTLHSLVEECGADLMGPVPLTAESGVFPILIKFLDAREDLSVQVHPDEGYTKAHPETHLKSEAWYVIQNDSGARILKGLKPGISRNDFEQAIQKGAVESTVQSIAVRAGDCHYLPSGTVHALGAGTLVAEVQTPSDTTFRVHDFDRIDPSTGKPRALHIDEALECINFEQATLPDEKRSHVAGPHTTVSRLVTSPYFTLEKVRFSEGVEQAVPYNDLVIWIMLEGKAEIKVDANPQPIIINRGDTVLLPSKMKNPVLTTLEDCVWLEVTFPSGGSDGDG